MTLTSEEERPYAGPGFHALIVGVSCYPYLTGGKHARPESYGMDQLTSAATSAHKFREWLTERKDRLVQPLVSCRVLLSPSRDEAKRLPAGESATQASFRRAVHAWREDASRHPDSCALFYFAGHGIQRGNQDAVLLLEDFNEPCGGVLMNAVDTNTIFEGMSPSQPQRARVAKTQLYFIDACRVEPPQFARMTNTSTTPVWNLEQSTAVRDDRRAPFCYASLPSGIAHAERGGQSHFSTALLRALDSGVAPDTNAPAARRWPVTVRALSDALDDEMERLDQLYGGKHEYLPAGWWRDAPIQFLPGSPCIGVRVCVDPEAASLVAMLRIADEGNEEMLQTKRPIEPYPVNATLPMGYYNCTVSIDPPSPPFREWTTRIKEARPGRTLWTVEVT